MKCADEIVMSVAILVIDRDSALQESAQRLRIERFRQLCIVEGLRLPKQEATVTVRARDQSRPCIIGEGQGTFQVFRLMEERAQGLMAQSLKDKHLCSAQKRRIESKARVLGRRAHEGHSATLDKGQKAVLLGAVEAMDLVHEEQCLLSHSSHFVGISEGFFEVGDARKYRADRLKAHPDARREQSCDAGFACARRSPQDHAGKFSSSHHASDGAFWPGQMLLADNICEGARPQSIGQRSVLARGLRSRRRGVRRVVCKQISHSQTGIGGSSGNATKLANTS